MNKHYNMKIGKFRYTFSCIICMELLCNAFTKKNVSFLKKKLHNFQNLFTSKVNVQIFIYISFNKVIELYIVFLKKFLYFERKCIFEAS